MQRSTWASRILPSSSTRSADRDGQWPPKDAGKEIGREILGEVVALYEVTDLATPISPTGPALLRAAVPELLDLIQRTVVAPGRNDPCPCGSGRSSSAARRNPLWQLH